MRKSGILVSVTLFFVLSFVGCAYKTDSCEPECVKKTCEVKKSCTSCPPCTSSNTRKPLLESVVKKSVEPKKVVPKNTPVLKCNKTIKVRATGQGVAPCNGACSPAQAFALAKRAAIADAYRLLAEKVKGVYVEGRDYVKNMAVKSTVVRTYVNAMIKNANIVETTFKDGLCEVEMEITLSYKDLALLEQ